MEKNKNEVVETKFVDEASEERTEKTAKGGKVKGFIKRHWKGAALVLLAGVGGYALGKKDRSLNGDESDGETHELPSGDDQDTTD